MILLSCRDEQARLKPLPRSFDVHADGGPVTFLVHGFNVLPERVRDAYRSLADVLELGETQVVGFIWPSAGNVFGYHYDFGQTTGAAMRFGQAVEYAFGQTRQLVNIVAHSMGNVVACKAIAAMEPGMLGRYAMHAPDVMVRQLDPGGEYQRGIEGSGGQALCYWSDSDMDLGFWTSFVRVGKRAGRYGIRPSRAVEAINAETVAGRDIGHGDYKSDARILAHTARFLRDGVIA